MIFKLMTKLMHSLPTYQNGSIRSTSSILTAIKIIIAKARQTTSNNKQEK